MIKIRTIENSKHLSIEVERAVKFLVGQIRKGVPTNDAYTQMEQSYGWQVAYYVLLALKRNFNH